ncbi:hypothetical protein N9427_00960 [Paracoccaceae bacterium]|nr:hypothetical protein [Paracoccaceae bacterium]
MIIKKEIGIFGTSGMAREAGDIAYSLGLQPFYITRDPAEVQRWSFLSQVILEEELPNNLDIEYVIGIADGVTRKAIAEKYAGQINFTNLIHPSATFGSGQLELVKKCRGTIIAAGARFTSGISVDDFCIFNQNITIAHDCNVESYVHVAPGANVSGWVHLQQGAWVGAGAVIIQGSETRKLVVGTNAFIGAGAVVTEDCDSGALYVGVPARRIN